MSKMQIRHFLRMGMIICLIAAMFVISAAAEQAESGSWLKGTRLQGNISEKDLQTWIDGLKK